MGAVWRRRAYVPRPALRLHAGEMFCAAFPAEPRSVAGARLQTGLADVADPETAGWYARGVEGDMRCVAWAKERKRRAHIHHRASREMVGTRSLSSLCERNCARRGARIRATRWLCL